MNTLYLFIDESGNFDFSPRGTKYFIVTAFSTFDPLIYRERLLALRYRLLSEGVNQEYFHATEDRQATRDEIFMILKDLKDTFDIHAVVAQKNKTHSSLYREYRIKHGRSIPQVTGTVLYQRICQTLLKHVFRGKQSHVSNVVVVLGSLFVGDKKKALLQTLKHRLKRNFPGMPFEIYSHRTSMDLNCQFADYCSWAIAIRRERREERPYRMIKSRIKDEFDMFHHEMTEYY